MAGRWHPVTLAGVLGIKSREIIAAYGAGGKTSLLQALARELSGTGGKVVLTTTTKIFPPPGIPLVLTTEPGEARHRLQQIFLEHPIAAWGGDLLPEGKLQGLDSALLEDLFQQGIGCYYLVEADGADRRPIKGYAPYEPVIPPAAGLLLPVLGLDALGVNAGPHTVHRPELFARQSGAVLGQPLSVQSFTHCLEFMIKRGWTYAPTARLFPILNKTDLLHGEALHAVATAVQENLNIKGLGGVILSAAKEAAPVKMILPPPRPGDDCAPGKVFLPDPAVSCIILAAGSGERMGRDKLFLRLGDKTILEHTVDAARRAAVGEIILVTRPQIEQAVTGLFPDKKVCLITNPHHREGMATSLLAGLAAINPAAQAVLLALGDQPFVTTAVYDALIRSYHQNWNLLTAPVYRGRRGHPVLLDRRTWPLLLELRGDRGARSLFTRLANDQITLVEVKDPGIIRDIDTPQDYRRYGNQP